METRFIDGGEYVDRQTYIQTRDENSALRGHIAELEDRIKLAIRLNYANYPGFVIPALRGEDIPDTVLETTRLILQEEGK